MRWKIWIYIFICYILYVIYFIIDIIQTKNEKIINDILRFNSDTKNTKDGGYDSHDGYYNHDAFSTDQSFRVSSRRYDGVWAGSGIFAVVVIRNVSTVPMVAHIDAKITIKFPVIQMRVGMFGKNNGKIHTITIDRHLLGHEWLSVMSVKSTTGVRGTKNVQRSIDEIWSLKISINKNPPLQPIQKMYPKMKITRGLSFALTDTIFRGNDAFKCWKTRCHDCDAIDCECHTFQFHLIEIPKEYHDVISI